MNKRLLAATSALALVAASGYALAQQQDKGGGRDKGPPAAQQQSPGAGSQSAGPQNSGAGKSAESKGKAGDSAQRPEPQGKSNGKSSAQSTDRGAGQGKAAERTEPKGKSAGQAAGQSEGRADSRADTKGSTKADRSSGRDQATTGASEGTEGKDRQKGTAQRNDDKSSRKGTAERRDDSRDQKSTAGDTRQRSGQDQNGQATKGASEGTQGSTKGAADTKQQRDRSAADGQRDNTRSRPQVAEEQRSQVGTTLLRQNRVNRVTNVNVSVRVGERLPRSVRLAALPSAVLSIAPAYSSYQYFVVDDRICIVDPATYVIVDVIETPRARTAGKSGRTSASLTLSGDERAFLVREIEPRGRATLGLGVLTVGAEIPRNIELLHFPNRVVTEIPQLGDYEYVVVEERIAIVEPADRRVVLVVER